MAHGKTVLENKVNHLGAWHSAQIVALELEHLFPQLLGILANDGSRPSCSPGHTLSRIAAWPRDCIMWGVRVYKGPDPFPPSKAASKELTRATHRISASLCSTLLSSLFSHMLISRTLPNKLPRYKSLSQTYDTKHRGKQYSRTLITVFEATDTTLRPLGYMS